ncbi:DUF3795 domain-containing protein [Butyrivibrio sp. CB08]|uniref:DUF3795 domain-containing protein n=1 Tax=Butyrivibrio sp. CB08 TaxID=2364879 RepID=UPI000EA902BF|nr:DUF3795 domain-containing protein [Butyrivibrio sp. CB08]RKM59160.1 DUF3795 domain-containing protein [Butyrivibrio sp. CB08]
MTDYIAFCGLDCEQCEARIATITDDNKLREKVAEEWSKFYGAEITPDMINCVGCRLTGVKSPYCQSMCQIRQCALRKNIETCGDCIEIKDCSKVSKIISNNPDAKRRLEKR